jgi:hypothetical protein
MTDLPHVDRYLVSVTSIDTTPVFTDYVYPEGGQAEAKRAGEVAKPKVVEETRGDRATRLVRTALDGVGP